MKVLPAQQRGYRFESWLKELFAVFRLIPRDAFRLVGEQVDGSFKMEGDFYLLEAKWQQRPTGARDLRDFEGKIQEKSSWTRGVFISWMGFSVEGLLSLGEDTVPFVSAVQTCITVCATAYLSPLCWKQRSGRHRKPAVIMFPIKSCRNSESSTKCRVQDGN